jgi:hypothetical protein
VKNRADLALRGCWRARPSRRALNLRLPAQHSDLEVMTMRLLLLLLIALSLPGCMSASIWMQHPDGRKAECNMHIGVWQAERVQRECADDYRRQGYERVPR